MTEHSSQIYGAIQIIRDTLSGRGVAKVSPNIPMGVGGLAKMSRDKFLLLISLVKVNKSLCHVMHGGGGRRNDTKCHFGEGDGP